MVLDNEDKFNENFEVETIMLKDEDYESEDN